MICLIALGVIAPPCWAAGAWRLLWLANGLPLLRERVRASRVAASMPAKLAGAPRFSYKALQRFAPGPPPPCLLSGTEEFWSANKSWLEPDRRGYGM